MEVRTMTGREDDADRGDAEGRDKPRGITPSSAERFGDEVSTINLGKLSDAEVAAFVSKLGKWDPAIGVPAGLPEIVAEARKKDGKTD
jgi:hypothetical protein